VEATILEFSTQHGTGRVRIDGAGELAFDATVARVKLDQLVAGRRVHVELGPSRRGGERVVKLWIPGSEPPPPPERIEVRSVAVGPFTLQLTGPWRHTEVVEKPGRAGFGGVASRGVSFDLNVLLGAGHDDAERARMIAAFVEGHAGAIHSVSRTDIAQLPFETHVFDGSPALEAGARYEMHVGTVYDDLILVGYALVAAEVPRAEAWRRLFLSMVQAAIVSRAPPR